MPGPCSMMEARYLWGRSPACWRPSRSCACPAAAATSPMRGSRPGPPSRPSAAHLPGFSETPAVAVLMARHGRVDPQAPAVSNRHHPPADLQSRTRHRPADHRGRRGRLPHHPPQCGVTGARNRTGCPPRAEDRMVAGGQRARESRSPSSRSSDSVPARQNRRPAAAATPSTTNLHAQVLNVLWPRKPSSCTVIAFSAPAAVCRARSSRSGPLRRSHPLPRLRIQPGFRLPRHHRHPRHRQGAISTATAAVSDNPGRCAASRPLPPAAPVNNAGNTGPPRGPSGSRDNVGPDRRRVPSPAPARVVFPAAARCPVRMHDLHVSDTGWLTGWFGP
jgi:hypothetical protein